MFHSSEDLYRHLCSVTVNHRATRVLWPSLAQIFPAINFVNNQVPPEFGCGTFFSKLTRSSHPQSDISRCCVRWIPRSACVPLCTHVGVRVRASVCSGESIFDLRWLFILLKQESPVTPVPFWSWQMSSTPARSLRGEERRRRRARQRRRWGEGRGGGGGGGLQKETDGYRKNRNGSENEVKERKQIEVEKKGRRQTERERSGGERRGRLASPASLC